MHTLAGQSNATPRYERRIIERTRLLELLDGVQARTVLLVAPAGYGKTTLARQWIERVGGGWVTLTAASNDVAVLARDLVEAIASVTEVDRLRVETALSAGGTATDQARAVARTLLAQVPKALDRWIVLDDCHFVTANQPSKELIARLESSGRFRLLITSRERPSWATSRRRLYMETFEMTATELALDEVETAQLLPPDRRTAAIRKQARGWPAVIALAAHTTTAEPLPRTDELSATLYEYFAEELYEQVRPDVQKCLTTLAVLPPSGSLRDPPGLGGQETLNRALATGLAYESGGTYEVHPLARDFLLTKFEQRVDAGNVAREVFERALEAGLYDESFELLTRLGPRENLERLIIRSYGELVATGRVATLDRFARFAAHCGGVAPSILELIAADVALTEGDCERAWALSTSAAQSLPPRHTLKARAYLVAGRSAHFLHRSAEAFQYHSLAQAVASSSNDVNDAAWGKYLAALTLEDESLREALAELESLPSLRVTDVVRLDTARTYGTFIGLLERVGDDPVASDLVSQVTDPWVRSGWGYIRGAGFVLRGYYNDAQRLLRETLAYIDEYGLAFGRPHTLWALAASELGQRHFARADALLHQIERTGTFSRDLHMQLNVRALRARLDLAQQRVSDAVAITTDDFDLSVGGSSAGVNRAMHGEYLATRALALATAGDLAAAMRSAAAADIATRAIEARVLAAATRAIVELECEPATLVDAEALLRLASTHQVWDGVVCCIRARPALLQRLTMFPRYVAELRGVLLRANDIPLAKKVGLVTRATGSTGVLSPREREIMEHVRQGRRNAEIAGSLFIAVGTVKRHLDHIYAKLGARSRAEAIARYAEIEIAETAPAP